MKLLRLYLFLPILLLIECENQINVPEFNNQRAYECLQKQVTFGPRVPGSGEAAQCLDYLSQHFKARAYKVDTQSFTYQDPYSSRSIQMTNVLARFRGLETGTPPILLVAHWDSRPRTDYHSDLSRVDEPIQGANDGASGVAVLMEMANLFAERKPACDVVLLLVDGEDWGKEGDSDNYLLGSREFASRGIRGHYRFGVVIDMVGDADQQFYREGLSNRYYSNLNDMIWGAARDLRIATFKDTVKHTVTDDHLPISAAGVPTVDIIDFDYPYWHTDQDTPDKCSPGSLGNVGRVLAEIAYKRRLWPND